MAMGKIYSAQGGSVVKSNNKKRRPANKKKALKNAINKDKRERKLTMLAKYLSPEKKYGTANVNGVSYSGSPYIVSLISYLTQGLTDDDDRVGNKINLTSLQLRFRIISDASVTDRSLNCGYFAVVLDRKPNGTPAAYTDIFTTGGSTPMQKITQDKGRFKILRFVPYNMSLTTDQQLGVVYVNEYMKLNLHTFFNSSGGIDINDLYLVVGSDQPIGDSITLSGLSRIRYFDA